MDKWTEHLDSLTFVDAPWETTDEAARRLSAVMTVAHPSGSTTRETSDAAQVGSARPYLLSVDEANVAHAHPWTERTIGLHLVRVEHFFQLGFSGQDAIDLAEGLHFRDVRLDRRHKCIECAKLRNWNCTAYRKAQLDSPQISKWLGTKLQDCASFEAVHELRNTVPDDLDSLLISSDW